MKEYLTVNNEIIVADPVETCDPYTRVMIVQDAAGQRYVVKRQHGARQPKASKRPVRKSLYITQKIEVTDPDGKVTIYPSARQASELLDLDYRTVHYHCRLGRNVKSGKFKGYHFKKVG